MNKEKMLKLTKTLVIIYMSLTFLSILLPDEFVIGITKLDYRLDPFQMIIRWFNFVGFLALPVAVYFDKSTFKKIAVYFCLPVVIIFMCMFGEILPGYVSELGTGIVDIRFLPEAVSSFMHNAVFRGIIFFAMNLCEVAVIVLLALRNLDDLKFRKEDIKPFAIILPLLIASIVPIYALEGIFDHQTNIDFTIFSPAHFVWLSCIVGEIYLIYRIFKNKSYDDKFIVILILALSLLIQYNQLFCSLGELTCKRMPLQLCNLASYLILIALVTKNREVFIFNLLVNVAGALIAIIVLDGDNSGVMSKGNVHYIVEHNNVVVIPILALMLRVFEPVKKGEFKIFLKWFTVYFVIIFILGTLLNTLYVALESDYFKCNYLFMFDPVKAEKLLPFTKYIFDLDIKIGPMTIYPVAQIMIYFAMCLFGYLSYIVFRKTIKDKEQVAPLK